MQVLGSCPAAVDGDDLCGDERRSVRRRELDGVGDFLRPAHTIERNAGDQAGLASAFPVKRFSISVSTGPGAIALTRTPNAAPSSAADLCQAFDGMLAGGVKRSAVRAAMTHGRRKVDDTA